jgi:hypothetical protein
MKDLEAFGNCRSTAEFLRWENGGDKVNSKLHIRIPIGLQLNLKCLWEKRIFRHRQRRLCSLPVQATCTEFLRSIGVALAFATLSLQTGELAAFAQATSGITRSLLAGTVVSSSGHPISAAILILQTNDGRIVAKGESDISGHFRGAIALWTTEAGATNGSRRWSYWSARWRMRGMGLFSKFNAAMKGWKDGVQPGVGVPARKEMSRLASRQPR